MSVQGNDNLKIITEDASEAFYFRYYSGHQGKFGHEFLEFDIKVDTSKETGLLRYVNSSNYRRDELIRKQVTISPTVVTQLKRMIKDSEIIKEDDSKWPEKNRDGKQELEIKMGKIHIGFETCKIKTLADIKKSEDPEGLRVFYYFVQDVKSMVFSLISLHFKIKPV